MGPLTLAVIALLGWMWWTGRLKRMTGQDAMAIAMAVLAVVLLAKGKPLLSVAPALLTGGKTSPGAAAHCGHCRGPRFVGCW